MKSFEHNQFTRTIEASIDESLTRIATVEERSVDEEPIVLIALSGGPDSTALLITMFLIAGLRGWHLEACHINHGLRGEESDADEEFCRRVCEDLDINLTVSRINPQDISDGKGSKCEPTPNLPPENRLRELRYEKLQACARNVNARFILTGHTLDDQAETVLFRMFRGTGLHGLKGIEAFRELSSDSGLWLLRPMLGLPKADCLRFLAARNVGARNDRSNEDSQYTRNFIRNEVVPLIESRFPGWSGRLEKLRRIWADENSFLNKVAEDALQSIELGNKFAEQSPVRAEWSWEALKSLDLAIQRRIIASIMRLYDAEPSFEKIEQVLSLTIDSEEGDTAVTLSEKLEVRLKSAGAAENSKAQLSLIWVDLEKAEDMERRAAFLEAQETLICIPRLDPDDPEARQSVANVITWLDRTLRVELWDEEATPGSFPSEVALEAYVNLERVSPPLTLRARRAGDCLQPFGMKEKVKLKKYLHTNKRFIETTPQPGLHCTNATIVLADRNEVLWIPQVGLSEKLRVEGRPSHKLTFANLAHPPKPGLGGGGPVLA